MHAHQHVTCVHIHMCNTYIHACTNAYMYMLRVQVCVCIKYTLADTRGTLSSVMAKWQTLNCFQAVKLILQPSSDDELEVDHYESSNESVEDEDVPKIDGNPEYETNKDGELNDEPGANEGGENFTFFKAPKRHVNNAADKQENISKKRGNPNLLSTPNVMFMCCCSILWSF